MNRLDELEAMQVAMMLISERVRQVQEEGYLPIQDDCYTANQLALAAASYCLPPEERTGMSVDWWELWPWDEADFKSSTEDREKDLIKAGALIIAEIQRLWRIKRKEYLDKFEDIPGYEGRYEANGYGILSHSAWKKGGMLTISYNKRIPVVNLIDKDGVRKQWHVEDLLKK